MGLAVYESNALPPELAWMAIAGVLVALVTGVVIRKKSLAGTTTTSIPDTPPCPLRQQVQLGARRRRDDRARNARLHVVIRLTRLARDIHAIRMFGAVIAVAGIATAYRIWIRQPAITIVLRDRFAAAYLFLSNKWYFDELIDAVVVRPALWLGGVVGSLFERALIGGVVTGGPVEVVRAGSAAVRRAQTGYLRYYAAAMVVGMFGVAVYFLVSSS